METIPDSAIADRLDAVLPQTQCGQCGYAGCRPYAEAMAIRAAEINRCPPGGDATVVALARLLEVPVLPLDPACGPVRPFSIARIVEADCIGCTLCIHACPVDAIVGAAGVMHTVIADHCTGCALCVPPCPVDCIVMSPAGRPWTADDARQARNRYLARNRRNQQRSSARFTSRELRRTAAEARARIRAAVAAALDRARARRNGRT